MIERGRAGRNSQRAVRIVLVMGLLASCVRPQPQTERQGTQVNPVESSDLIAATKRNLALQAAANHAGPPIHVDPYPHSAGMMHHHELPHR